MNNQNFHKHIHKHKHSYRQMIDKCDSPHCHLVNATLLIVFWFTFWSFLDYLFFYIFKILKIKNNALKLLTFAVASVVTIAVAVVHNQNFEFIPQYGF